MNDQRPSEHDSNDTRPILLLGAGGHAAVVAASARRAGRTVSAVAARERPTVAPFASLEWVGDPDDPAACEAIAARAASGACAVHLAVGDLALRARWLAALRAALPDGDRAWATIVDPSAIVADDAAVAAGAFVGAGAVVQARARVGACAIVNTRAVVEHDAEIGANAHVAPGAILAGGVRIGADALIGAGAVVLPSRVVGNGATVGAGAVVTREVACGVTVVGVPARTA